MFVISVAWKVCSVSKTKELLGYDKELFYFPYIPTRFFRQNSFLVLPAIVFSTKIHHVH